MRFLCSGLNTHHQISRDRGRPHEELSYRLACIRRNQVSRGDFSLILWVHWWMHWVLHSSLGALGGAHPRWTRLSSFRLTVRCWAVSVVVCSYCCPLRSSKFARFQYHLLFLHQIQRLEHELAPASCSLQEPTWASRLASTPGLEELAASSAPLFLRFASWSSPSRGSEHLWCPQHRLRF